MKKRLSVLMLFARSSVYKLMIIIGAMAVLQFAVYKMNESTQLDFYFGSGDMQKFAGLIFAGGFAFLSFFLIGTGEKSSKFGYTLKRLNISEREVLLLNCLADILMFAVFWLAEIMILFFLSTFYAGNDAYSAGPQGVFVDFYRSKFFHSVFPLNETLLWVRNILYVIFSGILCACASLRLRYGKLPVMQIIFLEVILVSFKTSVGAGADAANIFAVFILLYVAMTLVKCIHLAHDGRKAADDEEIII